MTVRAHPNRSVRSASVGESRRLSSISIAVAGITSFSILAVPRLGRAYEYDESVTVGLFVDQDSFLRSFTEQQVFNNHLVVSMVNWIVWHLGGTTEAWQRVLPFAASAACVALVSVWVAQRFGTMPAIAATALVATNPMFVDLGTQARGYAPAALSAAASTLLVDQWLRGGDLRKPAYVAAVALGLIAHLYVAIVVMAHGAGALRSRRAEFERWWSAAFLGGVIACVVYLPTLGTMARAGSGRSRRFIAEFPFDAATAYGEWLIVSVGVAGVATAALWTSQRRDPLWMAGVATATISFIWLVIRPHDLYPRFLVWAVPLVAVAVAAAARRANVVVVGALAVGALWWPVAATPGAESPTRTQASAYRALDAQHDVCTFGFFAESLDAYIDGEIRRLEAGMSCDVLVFRRGDAERVPPRFRLLGSLDAAPGTCVASTEQISSVIALRPDC